MATSNQAALFDEIVHRRRSVFPQDYTGERVGDDVITAMLEHARWAPTHRLTEPWRFVVFTGEHLKTLGEMQAATYKSETEKDGTFKEANYERLLTKPMLSSHIIVIAMKRDPKKSVPEVEEVGAVFCAVENMYLSAAAQGVAAYLSTGGITYFESSKALFGFGSEDRIIGFFHVGVASKEYPPSKRRPLSEVCRWFGQEGTF